MIKQSEIKDIARQHNVPISTIERDYSQNWLLKFLPEMAFKGGTCLRKIYFRNYRFSDDLDFTLLRNISSAKLEEKINRAVQETKTESNINFLDEITLKEVTTGYSFDIYFRITRVTGSPIKIKIDITKNTNESILDKTMEKVVHHPYTDKVDTKVLVYSVDEIFAEKTRALFERTRPRDIYDVWYLSKQMKLNSSLFYKKCEFKKIKPNIEELISRKIKFKNAWETSLRHQLPKLPSTVEVFGNVVEFLKTIL